MNELLQTEIKLEFVRQHCLPSNGWRVYVDIDASEEGRTGGPCKEPESQQRRDKMKVAAKNIRAELEKLDVTCGGGHKPWCKINGLPFPGDRDIIAFHPQRKIYLIVEVEGASSGQPEQKLYRAAGQLICAAGMDLPAGWNQRWLVLAVNGTTLADSLEKLKALQRLDITGIVVNKNESGKPLFGPALPSIT
jgi:hypothetical protein